MSKKFIILFLMGILAVGAIVLSGCSDDDDDVVAPTVKPAVFSMVFAEETGPRKAEGDEGYGYVAVSGVSAVPACTINGAELDLEPEMSLYTGGFGFYGDYELGVDNAVAVRVALGGDRGTGTANITMPGPFNTVGDEDIDVLNGDPHTFEWTASADVDMYWVHGYFYGYYYDTDGDEHYWNYESNFQTTDTEVTFTGAEMFGTPVDFDYWNYWYGDVDVMAVAGPMEAGDVGNVGGACSGFLLAVGGDIDWDIDLDSSKSTEVPEREFDLLGEYIQLMR